MNHKLLNAKSATGSREKSRGNQQMQWRRIARVENKSNIFEMYEKLSDTNRFLPPARSEWRARGELIVIRNSK